MVIFFREGGAHGPAVITTTDTTRFTTHLHTVPHGPRCSKNGARLPLRLPKPFDILFLFFFDFQNGAARILPTALRVDTIDMPGTRANFCMCVYVGTWAIRVYYQIRQYRLNDGFHIRNYFVHHSCIWWYILWNVGSSITVKDHGCYLRYRLNCLLSWMDDAYQIRK